MYHPKIFISRKKEQYIFIKGHSLKKELLAASEGAGKKVGECLQGKRQREDIAHICGHERL